LSPKKICFASIHDPRSHRTWSGTAYSLYSVLGRLCESIDIVSEFKPEHTTLLKLRFRLSQLFSRNFYYDLTYPYCRQYANQLLKQIRSDTDIVFTINSQLVANLSIAKPIVIYSDATFANLNQGYDYFSNLTWYDKRDCIINERKAFRKAAALIFSSRWAAETAINYYGINPEKVHVIPFGANLVTIPSRTEVNEMIELKSSQTHLNLLWSGVDFLRKGGDKVIEIVKGLRASGINAILDIIGPMPNDIGPLPNFINCHGRLDKDNPSDLKKMLDSYRKAHIFLLPAVIDCSPIVLNEAAAFGLPVLSYSIGGIPDIVLNNKTGILLDAGASEDRYIKEIIKLNQSKETYKAMALNARLHYESTLNWDVVHKKLELLFSTL
jgi:glycosyltransferase involved in cell wall biosynthesis